MARGKIPRKLWSQLTQGTRNRKVAYYKKQGLNARQVRERYNRGTLGSQAAARGHKSTPEHGLKEALRKSRKSNKYDKYLERRTQPKTKGLSSYDKAVELAVALNEMRDLAYTSMHRLHDYVYYNDQTVQANVYGGVTTESGPVPGMDIAAATWTASADIEDIRSMASEQYRGNPWFYH